MAMGTRLPAWAKTGFAEQGPPSLPKSRGREALKLRLRWAHPSRSVLNTSLSPWPSICPSTHPTHEQMLSVRLLLFKFSVIFFVAPFHGFGSLCSRSWTDHRHLTLGVGRMWRKRDLVEAVWGLGKDKHQQGVANAAGSFTAVSLQATDERRRCGKLWALDRFWSGSGHSFTYPAPG